MNLVSWNVNGLRACLTKGFDNFFKEINADVFCIQETKMQEEQLDMISKSVFDGYNMYFNSAQKRGYSGTAVFTKKEPLNVTYGMNIKEHDNEGRIITVEYEKFYLVNCYTPNVKRDLSRLDYRMKWEDDFRKYLLKLNSEKPVILCGDLNVAHNEIDIKNAKSNVGNAGFTNEERSKMSKLLESGFIDTFRHLYPDRKDMYSWWSYMRNAREKNIGWRIDYFIISESLKVNIKDAYIYTDIYGSDHCPVGIKINA